MSQPFITYAFSAGELSPELRGRTDIAKYPMGLEEALNMFVDYRGAAVSRPGLRMLVPLDNDDYRIFRFRALENDYLLMVSQSSVRFFREDGYLLEDAQTVVSVSYLDPLTVEVTGHGYSVGDWVYLNTDFAPAEFAGRYFKITATTTNTFELSHLSGEAIDVSAYVVEALGASPAVRRVHTVDVDFGDPIDSNLEFNQDGAYGVFTRAGMNRISLLYNSDLDWEIAAFDETPVGNRPAAPGVSTNSSSDRACIYGVTAVVDGVESIVSKLSVLTISELNLDADKVNRVSWDSVPGASKYHVYKSLLTTSIDFLTQGEFLGYLGSTYGNLFTDNGITPDFTKAPPTAFYPFAQGQILEVTVTDGGSGYSFDDEITLSGGNEDFLGVPILSSAGVITAVRIIYGGSGYDPDVTTPVASITGSGSGATFTFEASPTEGMEPNCFAKFQQRHVYAGTNAAPLGIWATKPGTKNNFDVSEVASAADGYTFALDALDVQPVQHLLSLRSGLLAFTVSGIHLLRAEEGQAVSAVNALAEPQAYKGASEVRPITIDLDVIFAERKGGSLNAMQYTEYTNTFKLEDLSVYSNHLIERGKKLTRLDYAAEPHKLMLALREDGQLLFITYDRKNEVFAWTRQETRGFFNDVCVAVVGNADTIYTLISRPLSGVQQQFLEVFEPRDVSHLEDSFCVDSGLRTVQTDGDTDLTFAAGMGTDIAVQSTGVAFSDMAVDDVIYALGGKFVMTAIDGGNAQGVGYWQRDATEYYHNTTTPKTARSGYWSWGSPISTVSGLWHLEGESLSVLADADVYREKVVTNGEITLDRPAVKVCAGLPFVAYGKPLSPSAAQAIIDGKRKTITDVAFRVKETRGLQYGFSLDDLYEMKDRSDEDWGEPTRGQNGIRHVTIGSGWDYDDSVYFYQDYPLPFTVLTIVHNVVVGDD
jgi:hypothetical protein